MRRSTFAFKLLHYLERVPHSARTVVAPRTVVVQTALYAPSLGTNSFYVLQALHFLQDQGYLEELFTVHGEFACKFNELPKFMRDCSSAKGGCCRGIS